MGTANINFSEFLRVLAIYILSEFLSYGNIIIDCDVVEMFALRMLFVFLYHVIHADRFNAKNF